MKIKAISEIDVDDFEMRDFIEEAFKTVNTQLYYKMKNVPLDMYNQGNIYNQFERDVNRGLDALYPQGSEERQFGEFMLTAHFFKGRAPVSICKIWYNVCGNNKLKPLLKECVDNGVELVWG